MFKSPFWASDQTLSASQNSFKLIYMLFYFQPSLFWLEPENREAQKKMSEKIEQCFLNLRKSSILLKSNSHFTQSVSPCC